MGTKSKYGTRAKSKDRDVSHPYTKEELRAMLPKVGDRRVEKMTASTNAQISTLPPQPCTVVEVNEAHHWYRVQFDKTGICQCFKLPAKTYNGPRVGWT